MAEMNRESRTMLKENPEEVRREVEKAAEAFLDDPPAFIDRIAEAVDPVDAVAFREPAQKAGRRRELAAVRSRSPLPGTANECRRWIGLEGGCRKADEPPTE